MRNGAFHPHSDRYLVTRYEQPASSCADACYVHDRSILETPFLWRILNRVNERANGLELSCPAEAGSSSPIFAHAGGPGAPPKAPARRVSFSELLGSIDSARNDPFNAAIGSCTPVPSKAEPAACERTQPHNDRPGNPRDTEDSELIVEEDRH